MQKASQFRHVLLGANLAASLVTAAPIVACETIHFQRGAYSATVAGVAPPDDVVCYRLSTGAGQRATLKVHGRNMMFSVDGVVDAQDRYSFTTQPKTYRIVVGQLMRSVTNERFSLFVEVR